MLTTLLTLALLADPGRLVITPGFVVTPGVLPAPPPAPVVPSAPLYQWITLTNEPGVEGYGYIDANGYAVGITQRRYRAGYAPAPAPVVVQQPAAPAPQYYFQPQPYRWSQPFRFAPQGRVCGPNGCQ